MGSGIYLLFYAIAALSLLFSLAAGLLLLLRRRGNFAVPALVWLLLFAAALTPVTVLRPSRSLRLFTDASGNMRIEARIPQDDEGATLAEWNVSARTLHATETVVILLLSLWFIAMMASVSYGLSAYFDTLRFLTKHSRECHNETVLGLFESARKRSGVRRGVKLRLMDADLRLSPCTCGILFPSVYIGTDYPKEYSDEWLEMVFLHELYHIRHHDALLRLAALFATSFHALVPLSDRVRRAVNEDTEFLCDRAVLSTLGEDARGEYMGVILDIAERNLREEVQPDGLLSPASRSGSFLMTRYRRMAVEEPPRGVPPCVAAILTAALVNLTLFGFCAVENPDNYRVDLENPILCDAVCRYFRLERTEDLTEADLAGVYSVAFFRETPNVKDPTPPLYCVINEEVPEGVLPEISYDWNGPALDLDDLNLFPNLRTLLCTGGLVPEAAGWQEENRVAVILRD